MRLGEKVKRCDVRRNRHEQPVKNALKPCDNMTIIDTAAQNVKRSFRGSKQKFSIDHAAFSTSINE